MENRVVSPSNGNESPLSSEMIKAVARDAGAGDVGIVDMGRASMAPYKEGLGRVMHDTRSLVVLAQGVHQPALQSQVHGVADQEFKRVWDKLKNILGRVVEQLGEQGIKAVALPVGFPMEMKKWPDPIWVTNEKLFAVEAGLGQMGKNRLVLHPRWGASMVLGTLVLADHCDAYDQPMADSPCTHCGLCAAVCPTGAVKSGDDFDFSACYSHNYRERMGGFQNWVEQVVESRSVGAYRRRVSDGETLSMWQNLSIGPQTQCDRCMAVCPAGGGAMAEFLQDRKAYVENHVKPFRQMVETIYAVKGSDAEHHVLTHFPEKRVKPISNGLRPLSIDMFLSSLPRMFQSHGAKGVAGTFHFTFTGEECREGTVVIRDQTLTVDEGLVGRADLHVTADSRTWLDFLGKEIGLVKALITRKIRFKGALPLLKAFGRCFPS